MASGRAAVAVEATRRLNSVLGEAAVVGVALPGPVELAARLPEMDQEDAVDLLLSMVRWFTEAGAEILGASFDSPAENKFFAEARRLPFRLLSDTERRVGEAYDVLKDPADRSAGLARRVTYLIAPEGTIREAYQVEDIEMHPAKVLADLRAILGIRV